MKANNAGNVDVKNYADNFPRDFADYMPVSMTSCTGYSMANNAVGAPKLKSNIAVSSSNESFENYADNIVGSISELRANMACINPESRVINACINPESRVNNDSSFIGIPKKIVQVILQIRWKTAQWSLDIKGFPDQT